MGSDINRDLDEFRERMSIEGELSQHLTEYLWNHHGTLRLGSEDFEVAGGEEVPGYGEDENVILIRRKLDGKVFEVDIEPEVHAARTAAIQQQRT
jgi:hypothetical protein